MTVGEGPNALTLRLGPTNAERLGSLLYLCMGEAPPTAQGPAYPQNGNFVSGS